MLIFHQPYLNFLLWFENKIPDSIKNKLAVWKGYTGNLIIRKEIYNLIISTSWMYKWELPSLGYAFDISIALEATLWFWCDAWGGKEIHLTAKGCWVWRGSGTRMTSLPAPYTPYLFQGHTRTVSSLAFSAASTTQYTVIIWWWLALKPPKSCLSI